MGSLGGGKHFTEICLETDDQVWVMLHSGSRAVGWAQDFTEANREVMLERVLRALLHRARQGPPGGVSLLRARGGQGDVADRRMPGVHAEGPPGGH